jgi:hypothetical protein
MAQQSSSETWRKLLREWRTILMAQAGKPPPFVTLPGAPREARRSSVGAQPPAMALAGDNQHRSAHRIENDDTGCGWPDGGHEHHHGRKAVTAACPMAAPAGVSAARAFRPTATQAACRWLPCHSDSWR